MPLPGRQSISVWLEDHPALLIALGIQVLAVNFWYDSRHPIVLLIAFIVVAILVVWWFRKLFFDFEKH